MALSQIEELARFAAQTSWEDIPEGVQRHAKLVLLDTLGVILAGSEQPIVRALRENLTSSAGTGASVFARGLPAADPRTAALLNGTAGRSIELCEGHRYVSCQAGVQILPAVLAAGELKRRSGREMLATLVVGYDLAVRFGAALTQRPLAHQNGQTAMLGAAAAGARLHGMDAEGISRTMRIGATFMLTPSYNNAVAGATTLNVAGGMSGFVGCLAPDLAASGFMAQEVAIEEALGSLVGDAFSSEHLLDDLGTRWEITRNAFRLRACCNPIYASLDAFEDALAALKPRPADIERVEVATYRFASAMRSQDPANWFAAKYSMPHAMAAIALRGDAGYHSFTEAVVNDPAVVALRRRVFVAEDPTLNAAFPRSKPARVTLTLKDGRQVTCSCDSPRGDFQRPYGEAEIRQKFRDLAQLVLTRNAATAVEQAVDRAEQWTSLEELTQLLGGGTNKT